MTTTLPPRTGMGPDELGRYLRDRLERDVTDVTDAYGTPIVTVAAAALPRAARLCKSDPSLAFDFFDWLSAVDLREEGIAVVVHLYSTRHRHHVQLRTVAPGGRTDPRVPSLTGVYRGANWHERETYDMFGVTFDGHPGLLPRLLTVENFEGWPLRKEFLLTTREAKPWPGAKEPEERHEEPAAGQAAAAGAQAAPAPAGAPAAAAAPAPAPAREREEVDYDQALYDQLIAEGKSERIARSRAKAAAMRARRDGAPAPTPTPDGATTAAAAPAPAEAAAPAPAEAPAAPAEPEPAEPAPAARQADDLDQAVYDQLLAEGKSERIARTRARAAALRARREAAPGTSAPPPGVPGDVRQPDASVASADARTAAQAAEPPAAAGEGPTALASTGTTPASDGRTAGQEPARPAQPGPPPVEVDEAAKPSPNTPVQPAAAAPAQPGGIPQGAPPVDGPAQAPAAPDLDQATYERLLAEGKSERIARTRARAAALRARREGTAPATDAQPDAGDVEGAAAAAARANAGDPAPASPEGAAVLAADSGYADPSIAKDAAAGAVGADVAAGAPGDRPGAGEPVSDPAAEARLAAGAPPTVAASPGPEAEGRHTGAVEQSGTRPAADTPGLTADPEGPAERGQGGRSANETPAPGPSSDVPGDRPGPRAPDVPVVPAPGAREAPLASDDLPRPDGGGESPLVPEDREDAPGHGTDAEDRGGPRYGENADPIERGDA